MAKRKPIKIITLDTETYNGLIGDIKRIAIFDGDNVTYGYNFLDIEPALLKLSRKFELHIYIHNLEFDARKIPEIFDKTRINWGKSFAINGKFATISCKKYTFHDSFKLLPMSLSKLSKDLEVEHGKLDLWEEVEKVYPGQYEDLVDFLDRCDKDDKLYLQYLGYDVMSLYEVIEKLIDISGIPVTDFVKRISTASLSRYLFKNGYKGKVFKAPLNATSDYEIMTQFNWVEDMETEEFLRATYCGGRTEVFKPYLDNSGYHYDINSLYPFEMLQHEYPVGRGEMYYTPALAKEVWENWLENKFGMGFIHAEVYIPPQHIPPLPVKMGKLVFPTGRVHGSWTFHELEYAVKECGVEVIEVFEVCLFKNTYPVFKNFILEFYQMKEQATIDKNESLRTFSKLIQNVGYGYTGMSRDKTQIQAIEKLDDYDINQVKFINEELGYIEVDSDIKSEYIQVQIASYVTSFARLELLKALRLASQNGNVYYCDTDSIVTDTPLPAELIHDTKIGAWALEGTPVKGIFLKPKVYSEVLPGGKTEVKFKGVTRETQKEMDFETYENLLADLIEGTKDYKVIEKNRTLLRSIMYMQKNDIDFDYYEMRDKKINLNTIEKRDMNYNENFTKPLHFETLDDFINFDFKPVPKVVQF